VNRGWNGEKTGDEAMKMPEATVTFVTPIRCIECQRPWLLGGERWRIKLLVEEALEAVPYCPECHAREFDGLD
jgi:hypothetical protein